MDIKQPRTGDMVTVTGVVKSVDERTIVIIYDIIRSYGVAIVEEKKSE